MQPTTSLIITVLATFSITRAMPAPDFAGAALAARSYDNPPFDPSAAINNIKPIDNHLKCSADTSDAAVVPFAQDPAWGTTMSDCVQQLNNDNWNGYECVPSQGPKFGFYKGGKKGAQAQDCYKACGTCLMKGITNQRAVTTKCTVDVDGGSCWMGFNYGG